VYAGEGESEQARTHLDTALSIYRKVGMHYWSEQAQAALQALP
jgi:hypothetical protein